MRPAPLIILAAVALYAAGTAVPFRVTHRLDMGCNFVPVHSLRFVGRANPSPADQDERTRCLFRKGLKSASPEIKVWLRKWPHEHGHPLPASPDAASVQVRPGR